MTYLCSKLNILKLKDMEQKAILWCRVSTEKQEVESQKNDLKRLAIQDGYKEENLIPIEAWGASAVKEDELYKLELEKLINLLETDKSITAVYIWEISRLARRQSTFHKLKDYFVDNKIQLVVFKPVLRLLKKDEDTGELVVDDGVTIGISMLAAYAETEGRERSSRTSRGRERNRKAGKFNGGAFGTLYGYTIDDGGYIIPNTEEAKVVEDMFKLYATGKYSVKTLVVELRSRGYSFRGRKITDNNVNNYLKNPIYAGLDSERAAIKPIITVELWKQVDAVLKGNCLGITKTKEYRHIHLGTGILKCRKCGYSYTYSTGKYYCYKHVHSHRFPTEEQCKDSVGINKEVADYILWETTKELEIDYTKKLNSQSIPVLRKEAVVIEQKIKATETRIMKQLEKKSNAVERQIEGDITLERLNQIKAKVEAEVISIRDEREKLQLKLAKLNSDIQVLVSFPKSGKMLAEVMNFDNLTDEERKALVVKHILTVTVEGKVDNYGKKYVEFLIFTKNDTVVRWSYYYTLKNRKMQIRRG